MPLDSLSVPIHPEERLDNINEQLRLIQKKNGLTFGTDAYLLAAFARSCPRGFCVDLGSGTGVIPLLCQTHGKYRHVTAAEIQPEFCDLIRRNTVLNGLEHSISVWEGDIRQLHPTHIPGSASVVLSNPPYMAAGSGLISAAKSMEIARRENNGTIADFCFAASRLLSTGGWFYTVFRPDRLADLISALRAASLEPKRMVTVYPDTESRPCLILVESLKDGAPELLQAPPLIVYQSSSDRTYTDAMQKIYDTFSMEFLFEHKKRISP